MTPLRPMTADEYAAWLAGAVPDYAADKVAAGQWARDVALDNSRKEFEELLPLGLGTPDNHLFTIVDAEGAPVGVLWFAVTTRFEARTAYVFDVSVSPSRRREGHAKRAFAALEHEVRRLGLAGIALHVFGDNGAAQALYAQLGYRPTNISLFKPLAAADAAGPATAP